MKVSTLLIRRMIVGLPTIGGIALMVFLVLLVMPGNPAELIQGEMVNPKVTEALIKQWGLDQPAPIRLMRWGQSVLRLDFGKSLVTGRPVSEMLAPRLGYSVYLGILGLLLGVVIGIPIGILCAVRPNTWLDYMVTLAALFGLSLPVFVTALILQLVFGFHWRIFPISGAPDSLLDIRGIRFAVLPALSVAGYQAAINARVVRTIMLEVIRGDYIRTAYSKGLTEIQAIVKHALPNVLIPVVTLLSVYMRSIIGGLLLVEIVFGWPGVGRLFYQAVLQRDYPVIQGVALIIAIAIYVTNMIVDLLYAYLDPRIRVEAKLQ